MILNFTIAVILLMLVISFTKEVVAQTLTSATIVGAVSDSSGAFVPHANVRITQTDTEVVRTTTTGDFGDYRFPFLKPGDYTVTGDGNLVENYNGEFLNANDYFNKLNNTPRARSVANQYAASIGGPILKDKLAVFVECPAFFVPVLMRETVQKGAEDGQRKEAYP